MLLPAAHILSAIFRPLYRRFSALGLDELLPALTGSRLNRWLLSCGGLPLSIDLPGLDGGWSGWTLQGCCWAVGRMNYRFIQRCPLGHGCFRRVAPKGSRTPWFSGFRRRIPLEFASIFPIGIFVFPNSFSRLDLRRICTPLRVHPGWPVLGCRRFLRNSLPRLDLWSLLAAMRI